MDDFVNFYPDLYTLDDLQGYVDVGFIAQSVVDARVAAVKAAATDQA